MSRAIALFNQAGGVGKTTITQNLGYQLSTRGHKVLLIDLDPQASLPRKSDRPYKGKANLDVLFGEESPKLPLKRFLVTPLLSHPLNPAATSTR
jgi:cellulose biosynthesis protein BcsQ